MNIICAPQGIVDGKRPGQGIGDLFQAGFDSALTDLSLFCPPETMEKFGKPGQETKADNRRFFLCEHPDELYNSMRQILEQCREQNLRCTTAMAPYLRPDTRRDDLNELLKRQAAESVEICGRTGCRYLIVRPLFAGIPSGNFWERNREFYLGLEERAKKYDVQILLENQCRDFNGHLVRGICSEARQAAEWVDALNEAAGEERFGFCMDVGVCNLCGQNMYDFIQALGKRLKAVILRDCDGNHESALLPFTAVRRGQFRTDWLNLIRGLREIGFDGELIVDIRDTASAFSPILRPELLRMAKSVAEYFKWQIGIENLLKKYPSRVLFGAGNMCRAYMKCYGEKYPPLFTCDNNEKLWGSVFEGLEVKNPQCLMNLPADCVVFICNIYYREIEAQLRQMGVKNPVEFFNDEYMPTFHFDRIERD